MSSLRVAAFINIESWEESDRVASKLTPPTHTSITRIFGTVEEIRQRGAAIRWNVMVILLDLPESGKGRTRTLSLT